jgi:hypothetical protein
MREGERRSETQYVERERGGGNMFGRGKKEQGEKEGRDRGG